MRCPSERVCNHSIHTQMGSTPAAVYTPQPTHTPTTHPCMLAAGAIGDYARFQQPDTTSCCLPVLNTPPPQMRHCCLRLFTTCACLSCIQTIVVWHVRASLRPASSKRQAAAATRAA
jgi:hypothetical protein